VQNCTLSGNSGVRAGAIYFNGDSLVLTNCTIAFNSVTGSIAGADVRNGVAQIINCTITANSAGTAIGGLRNAGSLSLGNSIVSGNTSPGLGVKDIAGAVTSLGHNIIGTSVGSSGFIASDRIGVPTGLDPMGLRNNGGPTLTIALLPGSIAIDQGDSALASSNGLATDERGFQRFVDGPD